MYDTVYKKKGIVQMIAMNRKEFDKIYGRLTEERMRRRILFYNVKYPFSVNIKRNIQNNYINNNFNIKKSLIDREKMQENEQKHIQQTGKLLDDYYFNREE